MTWLQSIDDAVFRFINDTLSNPVFDAIMPQFSTNHWFVSVLILTAIALITKGGRRGCLLVIMLLVVLGAGDGLLINGLKDAIERPRPFLVLEDVNLLVGRGRSGSMPSSHTATWFAGTFIAFVYYRRSWRFMLPLASTIAFSRVYLGVHYPSDTIAGAILGAGYAAVGVWTLELLWNSVGKRLFPIWWRQLPSLLHPVRPAVDASQASPGAGQAASSLSDQVLRDRQYLCVGYLVVAILFIARLIYLAGDKMELSEDEAYQWVWSKHLALSYYSKPPMIAFLQFFGTSLWGDTAFGVRFFSPVIAAGMTLVLLHFFAREVGARIALWLVLVAVAVPLLSAGSILMTIDPPLVMFWIAATLAAWRALSPGGTTVQWLWVGVWLGLAFLSKYSALFFVPSIALFFLLYPSARVHLRRPGPWLALLILCIATLPVLIWNAQNDWITVRHVSENAKLHKPWVFNPKFFLEFTGAEFGLLNPIFFVGMLIATVKFWRNRHENPLQLYMFTMGAPVFFGYWLYTIHSRVHPNWIAPAVVPLLALMVLYWEQRSRQGMRSVKRWFITAVIFGLFVGVVFHDTDIIRRLARRSLPSEIDPMRRVRAISSIAELVGDARRDLESEGTETFIIASHYGLTGQISFYLPEAREGLPDSPLVYVRSSDRPKNQFFFWPEYRYVDTRKGQNAIYVDLNDTQDPPPKRLLAEFESVTDLGVHKVRYRKRVMHRVQLFACRNLR